MVAQIILAIIPVLLAGYDWKFSLLVAAHMASFFVIRLEMYRLIIWAAVNVAVVLTGYVLLGLPFWLAISPMLVSYLVAMYQFIFESVTYAKGKGFFKRG